MIDAHEAMIYCIKREIMGIDGDFGYCLSDSEITQLYELSMRHDLAHIVGNALITAKVVQDQTENCNKFRKSIMMAVYRYEQSNYKFKKIAELFEKEQILFIPLKGVILRELYPSPWMRTSCDIDILVKKDDIDRASRSLITIGFAKGVESPHDITFVDSSGCHIELHHSLIENERVSNIDFILDEVWERTKDHAGNLYWRDMTDEMFYFYHIAHMAKHFLYGGCGVKPFIDLWILDSLAGEKMTNYNALLQHGNLLKFAEASRKLNEMWFCDVSTPNTMCQYMENYILRGGVYGIRENSVIVQQQKKGGRFKYFLSKIFLPYNELKYHYPILQKHCWLMPIMQVRRWFKLLFCGHAKRSMRELSYNSNISKSQADEMKIFLDEIGL